MAMLSGGEVHVKLTCDASQFIREIKRAERALRPSLWRRFVSWLRRMRAE